MWVQKAERQQRLGPKESLTDDRQIQMAVSSGRRLEVHPAAVDPGLLAGDPLHGQGRRRGVGRRRHRRRPGAHPEVGTAAEAAHLVAPSAAADAADTRVVTGKRKDVHKVNTRCILNASSDNRYMR